jgi:hypothetical protein
MGNDFLIDCQISARLWMGKEEILVEIARERFELSSAGPEPAMLGRYTTGLISEIVIGDLTLSPWVLR